MELITYRKANKGDLGKIKTLLYISDLPVEGIEDCLSGTIVALADNNVVACAAVEPCCEYGLLRSVAVSPEMRGRGLGLEITSRTLEAAAQTGISEIYLLTLTAADFFPKFAFSKVDRSVVPLPVRNTAEFSSICPVSAVVMKSNLPAEKASDIL